MPPKYAAFNVSRLFSVKHSLNPQTLSDHFCAQITPLKIPEQIEYRQISLINNMLQPQPSYLRHFSQFSHFAHNYRYFALLSPYPNNLEIVQWVLYNYIDVPLLRNEFLSESCQLSAPSVGLYMQAYESCPSCRLLKRGNIWESDSSTSAVAWWATSWGY